MLDLFNGLIRERRKKRGKALREYSKCKTDSEKNVGDHWRRDALDTKRRIQELDGQAERYGLKRRGRGYVPISTETQ